MMQNIGQIRKSSKFYSLGKYIDFENTLGDDGVRFPLRVLFVMH